MKQVLVISEITYVPGNYYEFLHDLVSVDSQDISGVIILQNFGFEILVSCIWLYLIGCKNIATTLFWNCISLQELQRERLLASYQIPVLKPRSMNDKGVIEWIKKNEIDCVINVRTRCIYKDDVLSAPRYGCYNIHHGILPNYRGMYCDIYALFERRPAGFALHKMNSKIDDGAIISTKIVSKVGEVDYIRYLSKTTHHEVSTIKNFMNYCTKNGRPPTGRTNSPQKIVYTRTPSIRQILQMQRSGIIL